MDASPAAAAFEAISRPHEKYCIINTCYTVLISQYKQYNFHLELFSFAVNAALFLYNIFKPLPRIGQERINMTSKYAKFSDSRKMKVSVSVRACMCDLLCVTVDMCACVLV